MLRRALLDYRVLRVFLVSSFVLACSSSNSPSGGGADGGVAAGEAGSAAGGGDECGVSGATTLAATTTTERATLCDCTNALEGGYGKSFPCDGGITVSNKKDQAACLAAWTPCTNATVADALACTHAIVEHDRCDLGAAFSDSRCAYLASCAK